MKWIIFRSKFKGGKNVSRWAGSCGCLPAFFSFLPRKAALPGNLFLALREVQMGTINKGTRSVLSPSESALAVGQAFSGPGSGERLGGRRSDMLADGASWNS